MRKRKMEFMGRELGVGAWIHFTCTSANREPGRKWIPSPNLAKGPCLLTSRDHYSISLTESFLILLSKINLSPDWCGSGGWTLSHKLKGHWFNFQSGHIPGLWGQVPIWRHARGNLLIFLYLSFSLLSPLSKNKYL